MSKAPLLPSILNRPASIALPVPAAGIAPSTTPRLLGEDDAAKYLGCSRRQIRYLVSRGLLHSVRLDRRLRLDRHEIDALIARAMQRDLRPPPRASNLKRVAPSPPGRSDPRCAAGSTIRDAAP